MQEIVTIDSFIKNRNYDSSASLESFTSDENSGTADLGCKADVIEDISDVVDTGMEYKTIFCGTLGRRKSVVFSPVNF